MIAKKKPYRRWFWPLISAMIIGLIILKRDSLLGLVGEILVKSDRERWQPGDYIVVLMGDLSGSRAQAALDLWKQNQSQSIVMMEENRSGFVNQGLMPPPSALHRAFFEKNGVPSGKLVSLNHCSVDSTLDEATCFYHFLQGQPQQPHRVSLVTSFYHTSRASWIFQHVFYKLGKSSVVLQMIDARAIDAAPPPRDPATHSATDPAADAPRQDHLWWKREDLFIAVFNEYLKWTYWQLKGLPTSLPVIQPIKQPLEQPAQGDSGALGGQNRRPDHG